MITPHDKTAPLSDKALVKFMVGKTIKAVENSSMNVLNMEFTDGTELMLESEHISHGVYGSVGYIRKLK